MKTAQTKDGRAIDLLFFERDPTEQRDNFPWVIHRVEAHIDGELAGYLKISYIPKKNRWKSGLEYKMSPFGGTWSVDQTTPETTWDDIMRYMFFWRGKFKPPHWDPKNRNEVQENLKAFNRWALTQTPPTDDPIIDYIHVEPDFRRQGVGTAMYLFGAREMGKRGLKLRSSTVQSDEAKAVWKSMKSRGLAKSWRGRPLALDFRKKLARFWKAFSPNPQR